MKSEFEQSFTSTGAKFWRHKDQLASYREGTGRTVVSTHISPEGVCNLKCKYCSVTYREITNRIPIEIIKKYVDDLVSRGLKAAILTGGGEPTLYPHLNELVRYIKDEKGISVALITNGTQTHRVEKTVWKAFSWVRVSINLFEQWETKIKLPLDYLDGNCVVGSSFVCTEDHQDHATIDVSTLKRVAAVATKLGATYIRLLPNCLLPQKELIASHEDLDHILEQVDDSRFFHQYKLHEAPKQHICHQSYFRPYLSEVPFRGSSIPGSVYPCDSVVLNDSLALFHEKYQLCGPNDILDYMDGVITHGFDPTKDCSGCVFTKTVNDLGAWKGDGVRPIESTVSSVMHEEFV